MPSLHISVIPPVTIAAKLTPPELFFNRKVTTKMLASLRPFAFAATLLMLSAAFVAVVMHSRQMKSMLMQKEATLQYRGPLYVGEGEWERKYTASSPQVHTAILARAPLNKVVVKTGHPNQGSASTGLKVAVGPTARKGPVRSKILKADHKFKPLRKAAPSLSSDVGQFSDEISDGLTKIFHLHDNPVTMRSPVKILDHV